MDLPSHPEADDPRSEREPAPPGNSVGTVVIGLLVALVAVLVILHLTGVVGPAR